MRTASSPKESGASHRTPKPRAKHRSTALASQLLECGATAPLWSAHEGAGGMLNGAGVRVRRGSAALVRPRSSGQEAQRAGVRVVQSRTKAVLRTALQNCELRTDPSLTQRSLWSAARQRRFGPRSQQPPACSGESARAGSYLPGSVACGVRICRIIPDRASSRSSSPSRNFSQCSRTMRESGEVFW